MIETSIWHFKAEGDPSKVHTVQENKGEYTCTCPVFTYSKGRDCRHVRLVKSGLAGMPINEEPELTWGAVDHVQKYRGKVLVPFLAEHDDASLYRVLWDLRQLGISKRRCCEFLGVRAVSDAVIETFLRSRGLIGGDEGEEPAQSDHSSDHTWAVSSRVEEVTGE